MLMKFARVIVLVAALAVFVEEGTAGVLTLHLTPNVYTVAPGGQITLRGLFSTPDDVTYTCRITQPRCSALSSCLTGHSSISASLPGRRRLLAELAHAYFQDGFGNGGYLGPTLIEGPTVTATSDLRNLRDPSTPNLVLTITDGVGFEATNRALSFSTRA